MSKARKTKHVICHFKKREQFSENESLAEKIREVTEVQFLNGPTVENYHIQREHDRKKLYLVKEDP